MRLSEQVQRWRRQEVEASRALGSPAGYALGHARADEIAADVEENHVQHMIECTACTWWYCDHYPCDCHESCVGRHDVAGNPIEVVA